MNIDSGPSMSELGEHPGQQQHPVLIEFVSGAIGRDRISSRIAQDYLVNAAGGRVSVVCSLYVLRQHLPYSWNRFKERVSRFFGRQFVCRRNVSFEMLHVTKAFGYLIAQM